MFSVILDQNLSQDTRRVLTSISSAQELIQEDINEACSKLPSNSAKFLNERFSESLRYRERLVNRADQIQAKIEDETFNSETDVKLHLDGCIRWLSDLKSMLENKDELYQDSKTIHDRLKTIQVCIVIFLLFMFF